MSVANDLKNSTATVSNHELDIEEEFHKKLYNISTAKVGRY